MALGLGPSPGARREPRFLAGRSRIGRGIGASGRAEVPRPEHPPVAEGQSRIWAKARLASPLRGSSSSALRDRRRLRLLGRACSSAAGRARWAALRQGRRVCGTRPGPRVRIRPLKVNGPETSPHPRGLGHDCSSPEGDPGFTSGTSVGKRHESSRKQNDRDFGCSVRFDSIGSFDFRTRSGQTRPAIAHRTGDAQSQVEGKATSVLLRMILLCHIEHLAAPSHALGQFGTLRIRGSALFPRGEVSRPRNVLRSFLTAFKACSINR